MEEWTGLLNVLAASRPWCQHSNVFTMYINHTLLPLFIVLRNLCEASKADPWLFLQGWGVAVLVGVPNKDDAFKTHPVNFLNERTLKGTFYGNYKPRTDLPSVVEKYMNGVSLHTHTRVYILIFAVYKIIQIDVLSDNMVFICRNWNWRNSSLTPFHSQKLTKLLITCWKGSPSDALSVWESRTVKSMMAYFLWRDFVLFLVIKRRK